MNDRCEDGIKIELVAFKALSGGAEIAVTAVIGNLVESEEKRLVLLARQFSELGLKKGEISRERFEELELAAEISLAVKRGMNILGYGSSSEKNLSLKLRGKGFSKEVSEAAAEYLLESGFIDEGSDAAREAERCLRKQWGRKRIYATLRQKGYSDEAISSAMAMLDEVDFATVCLEVIMKRYADKLGSPEELQKTFGALSRLGFSTTEIKTAIKQAVNRNA